MGDIRLRRRQFWSAGASEARPRFGSLGTEFRHRQSAVAAALCRRTPKIPRATYPADSSVRTVTETCAGFGALLKTSRGSLLRRHVIRLNQPGWQTLAMLQYHE